jgi:ribosomal protein L35AE/L33A
MHAVIVRVTIHDRETADSFLKEQVVPRASQAPGFVTGHWVRLDGARGTSLAVFESEEAATAARENAQFPPEDVVTVDSIDVGEVVANA